ncbi:DUF4158 domain-containing protein [Streptomyces sp. C1-1]|uniref:DUF4158 domain-containing protein n=1 Tax=Streptomyces sp. C1-1 TaxID=3231173 RepID=UPI003CFCD837
MSVRMTARAGSWRLLVMLKSAARLGRVPKLGEIPEVVVAHVRDQAGLAAGTVPEVDSERSEERYRSAVRERLELKHKPGEARAVAEAAMRAAAPVKAHTADLVNVALEELVRQKERLELPAFSTLDRMAARIRSEVEASRCEAIVARMSDAARERVAGMLEVVEGEYRSLFAWVKQPARRATWSRFRAHAERMERVDGLGDAVFWVGRTPPAKVAALAEQARVLSVGEMKDIAEPRRTALTVCLLAQVQAAVRDETVVMLSKRMSRHLKRAQEELLEIEKRQKETTEQLLATFRDVLTALRGSGEAASGGWEGEASLDDLLALKRPGCDRDGGRVRRPAGGAGGPGRLPGQQLRGTGGALLQAGPADHVPDRPPSVVHRDLDRPQCAGCAGPRPRSPAPHPAPCGGQASHPQGRERGVGTAGPVVRAEDVAEDRLLPVSSRGCWSAVIRGNGVRLPRGGTALRRCRRDRRRGLR